MKKRERALGCSLLKRRWCRLLSAGRDEGAQLWAFLSFAASVLKAFARQRWEQSFFPFHFGGIDNDKPSVDRDEKPPHLYQQKAIHIFCLKRKAAKRPCPSSLISINIKFSPQTPQKKKKETAWPLFPLPSSLSCQRSQLKRHKKRSRKKSCPLNSQF